jgi:hypothetical protein
MIEVPLLLDLPSVDRIGRILEESQRVTERCWT